MTVRVMVVVMMQLVRVVGIGHADAVGRFRVGHQRSRRVVHEICVVLIVMVMIGVIATDRHGRSRDEEFVLFASHQIVHAH